MFFINTGAKFLKYQQAESSNIQGFKGWFNIEKVK